MKTPFITAINCLSAACLWAISTLSAQAVLVVNSVATTASNPGIHLLEAEALDPNPSANREAVNAVVTVTLSNPSILAADSIEIESTFSLVKQSDGLPVDLQTDPVGPSVVVLKTFNLSTNMLLQPGTLEAALRPVGALDPTVNYHIEASVRTRPEGGAWSAPDIYTSAWRQWVHFTNTTADDNSLNVKLFPGTLALTDRQILRSAPGQENFHAILPMTLHRYDLESVPQGPTAIPLTFALRLLNSTNPAEEVPLANPSLTVQRNLLARTASSQPDPVIDTWTQGLFFAPAAGAVVDPKITYLLEVTVTATQPDTTIVPAVPPVLNSPSALYLVLSGQLKFGGITTTFTQLGNDPLAQMVFDLNTGVYTTKLAVAAQSGKLTTAEEGSALQSRRYGDGVEMDVTYDLATGDATVVGGVTQAFTTPATDVVLMGGLRLVRGPMRLGESGAKLISGGVFFPAGLGVSTAQNSRRHQPTLNFANEVTLNNDFTITPYAMDFPPPSGSFYHVFCDRLPLRFRTDKMVWNMAAGTFHFSQVASDNPADPAGPVLTRQLQELELSIIAPYLSDPSAAIRPSNDAFLKNITATTPIEISVGTQGQALISVHLDLGPSVSGTNTMTTHFPQGVTLAWSEGRFTLAQSVVTEPSYLTAINPITVSYKRDCFRETCSSSGPGSLTFVPTNNQWKFTADGGIAASGNVTPDRLRWGTTTLLAGVTPPEGGPYAYQTSNWTEGAFHAPGTWLAGGVAPGVTDGQLAQSLLHSGVLPNGSFERPQSDGYRAGLGDYAGLNLRVGTAGAKTGRSILAGWTVPDVAFPPYELNALSKYYVRASGVTGIHQAVALVPSSVVMYGFQVEMDGFRLSFRDGQNVESKIGGSVRVKDPVTPALGFNLAFKNLMFSCSGLPGNMQLANEGEVKTLAYWGTDIVPLSMDFTGPPPTTGCPNINDGGFLAVGVQTSFPSVTPQKLHAVLGFLSTGNLVTPANPLSRPDISSRFVLPPNLQIEGAGGVPWEVTVSGHAYLNNPDPGFVGHPTAPPRPTHFIRPEQGFLTFPGTINVPWFEDVKVQFHVSATSTATPSTSVIHVMGGWPSNPSDGTGTGWNKAGATYFSDKLFDKDHLAFPADIVPGMVVSGYRNSGGSNAYKPVAQKRWIGVVDFTFPLIWDGTQRKFTSITDARDLLVLGNVNRQLQSLTPSTAEITFGLQLDIPRLNTQSLVAAVKEGLTGVVADALSGAIKVPLGNGLTQLDSLLSQRVSATLEAPLNAATDPVADLILGGTSPTHMDVIGLLAGNLRNVVPAELTKTDGEIDNRITSGLAAITAALALVEPDGNGNRSVVSTLMRDLVLASGVPGASTLDPGLLNTKLAEVLAKVNPDLAQAEQVMLRAQGELSAAKTRLNAQVPAVFVEHQPDLISVANAAMARLATEKDASGWLLLSETAKRDRIRRIVQEGVMGSPVVPRFQFVVRQNIQDTNEFFRSALDSVFGQVNHVVRDVIKLAITQGSAQLDAVKTETRSPALDELGDENSGSDKGKIAAINIEGYAQINDESLQELTINGRFEFNVPDSLKVQAHLHIKQYTTDSPPAGCRAARGDAIATVTVAAQAQCDWIGGPGTEVGVKAHFTMIAGQVRGFDGSFLLKGHIVMGPLTLSEIGVSAGFGTLGSAESTWAYVSGTGRGLMEGYEAAVGIFLGRTCNIEVLRSVDRFVDVALTNSKVDKNAAITGVYFYGEAWFPLNEVFGIKSTCFLTLKAGGGTGHFAFIGKNGVGEDTLFVGCKFLYGVEGTVLCVLSARGSILISGAVAMPVPAPFTGKPAKSGGLFGLATGLIDDALKAKFTVGGEGKFSATFGICPACKSISKTLGFTWTINPAPGKLGFSF